MGDPDPNSSRRPVRRGPRMGVSSLSQQRPICPPTAPRSMPRTVPGLSRTSSRRGPDLDKTVTCHVKSPDYTKFGPTMEELSKLEFVEMQNIEDDLRDFHIKRRKLVFSIASINLSKVKKSIKKTVSKMGL